VGRKVKDLMAELAEQDPEAIIKWNLYWDVDYESINEDTLVWPEPAFESEILDKLEVHLFYDEPD
jgi:hypothetical protein